MPQRYTVVIKQNRYIPNSLHVNVGDEIVWDNQDGHHHTATSSSGAFLFDTGEILGGSQSRSVMFSSASEPSGFEYYCTYHDFMIGRVFVLPPAFALAAAAVAADPPGPTYDLPTWGVIARHVVGHWVLDMADNFAYALTIHRDADFDLVKTSWDQIETWWQNKTGSLKKIIGADGNVDPSSFVDRTRAELEDLGRQVRMAHVKLRPRVFRYPAPIRPDAVLHPGELYEGQSTDPFGEAVTVNFVDKPIQDAEVRHEAYAGALLMIEIANDTGTPVTADEKTAYRTARQQLTLDDFHLLAAHLYRGLSELFGSDQFVEDKFAEGIRRMTVRGEWDGSVFPLWHWLRWIDGYVTVKTSNQLPDPVGLG
jgi:hypothetical protein